MTSLGNVQGPRALSQLAVAGGPAKARASLLPPPNFTDPKLAIYALLARQRDQGAEQAKSDATAKRNEEQIAMAEVDRALERQKEAEESASFWDILGDVFSFVAIAATSVATLCTGGATALAACALSVTSFVESKTQFLEKAGLNEDLAKVLGLGCAVGGGILGGIAVANDAEDAVTFLGKASRFASIVENGCTIGRGTSMIGHAYAEYGATMALADSEVASGDLHRIERAGERTVALLKETARSYERALGTLVEITSEESKTRESLVRSFA